MAWTAYPVTFKLLSPLHVGWRKVGNLQQTRSYLTGRNLWGALTARLTREGDDRDYVKMGGEVDNSLTYTYFYPSTNPTPDELIGWPWHDPEGFAWRFLNSYASTALTDGRSSEEGSLHETEFIAPCTRDGEQVYLVGYIFEKEGCALLWRDVLSKLNFGGEQGYGWGRVQPYQPTPKPLVGDKCFGDFKLDLAGDAEWPVITVPAGNSLLAHTKADSNLTPDIEGIIEPLVGLETTKEGKFGQQPSVAAICYQPGSKTLQETSFSIKERGIWCGKKANEGE